MHGMLKRGAAILAAILPTTALHAQDSGQAPLPHPLEVQVDLLKTEIAALRQLTEYADDLERLADADPSSARQARVDRNACSETPLLPWCNHLQGLFQHGAIE